MDVIGLVGGIAFAILVLMECWAEIAVDDAVRRRDAAGGGDSRRPS